ncbi:MAG TPA: hypothetical protein PLC74_01585 [Acetobacteraceae bacterium]|nr:hypothetical protein [Acetobacteraceae bacterium]
MIHYSKYQRHILGLALFGGLTLAHPMRAYAIPSFAAQTGEPCSACHIGFPQLTAFGREFKLQGYVAGGMFPQIKNLAVMSQIGYTALHSKVPGGLAPDYPSNNAYSIQQTSLFFGGALYEPLGLGAFIQTTYDGVAHQLHWDNTDIRMTRTASLFDKPLFYGFTFNNNPGVTDLWNTPPSWGYPFITAELGVGSAASVQLSSLAQSVSGIGTYGALNLTPGDMIYAEADIYKSLPNRTAYALGVGPASVLDGSAPYWRLAYQHSWAGSSVEIGTIGLLDHPYPSGFTHGPSDELLDVGLDSQIQWINANHALSFQAAYIHEHQHWSASYPLGLTANPNDTLDTLTLTVSYLLHQKYGVTGTYNQISGNADQALYAASPIGGSANNKPNTTSYTTELDYYPFNTGGPKFFPWANAKFFVENTIYTQFNGLARNYDGSGRSAQGNDVLFTGIWLAF